MESYLLRYCEKSSDFVAIHNEESRLKDSILESFDVLHYRLPRKFFKFVQV
ncbi:hypothetical protein [Helicobacter sp. MIT 05-5294]|uniref:hypothetical protein n=1 Tax=Helicobacter sp. MIT 05-5294 TaxID=1548150 RepID=UPI001883AFA5|nr:hypothetical protein [Helicobacter sp. MIT 05-5294]